jgi:ribosomal protein S18 acetylase RimI-like enzyme
MSSSLLREATEADAEAIAVLFHAAFGAQRMIDPDEVRSWFANAEIRPENVRVLEVDGSVAGYGDVWPEDDNVMLDVAAPGHWDVFFDWAEERARAAGVPQVRAYFAAGHALERVVQARGYRYWRSSYTMQIELHERPPAVLLETRAYRDEDGERLRALLNDAFSQDPTWSEITESSFREFYLRARGFDPELWFLVWDGDDLVASALTFPERFGDTGLGWVSNLAVRSSHRRRGLGEALLRHAFRALYDRGLRRVGLGVDTENVTGALRLYERAGMRPILQNDNWVLDLR